MSLFCSQASWNKRSTADAIVIPFWKESGKLKLAVSLFDEYASIYQPALDYFSGKNGEVEVLYTNGSKESRIFLLGLEDSDALTEESVLEAFAQLTRELKKAKCSTVNIVLPTISQLRVSAEKFLSNACAGILSLNYDYPKYYKEPSEEAVLTKVTMLGVVPKIAKPIFEREEGIFQGVYLARDLVNGNADNITPQTLADTAKHLAQTFASIDVKVLDKKAILKEKMGLLAAVAKGAAVDPRFIIVQYQGKPKSKDHTVLIGKGVTFDSGGLDLKPGKAMLTMREDMAGAGVVLGIMSALARLQLPVNVTGVIPATENAIGSSAFKMGDVYVGMTGLSVEIGSTDAEGRLILADAISYSLKHLKPTRIIDFATLTGAMVVSLGEDVSGFFCNDDSLAQHLMQASVDSSEPLWRMPLVKKYDAALQSDIADMKNLGNNRAGSITAALFLQRFLEGQTIPWAHLDIAGTAYREKDKDAFPKYASGFGVRCLIYYMSEFLNKTN